MAELFLIEQICGKNTESVLWFVRVLGCVATFFNDSKYMEKYALMDVE